MSQGARAAHGRRHAKGWFARKPGTVGAVRVRSGILVLVLGVGLTVLLAADPRRAARAAGGRRRDRAPDRGAVDAAPHGEGLRGAPARAGFRRFIDESEKDRAQFAERKNLFSEYLPYAIVFGATEKWAKAFAGLDDQPPDTSSWYVRSTRSTTRAFTSAIDSFA